MNKVTLSLVNPRNLKTINSTTEWLKTKPNPDVVLGHLIYERASKDRPYILTRLIGYLNKHYFTYWVEQNDRETLRREILEETGKSWDQIFKT